MIMMEEEELVRNTLPKDIHMEILSWLPSKSLISSFKFICKAWRNLIHDPVFVKMHLSRGGRDRGRTNRSLIRKFGNGLYQLHPPFNFDYQPPLDLRHLSSAAAAAAAAATKLDIDFDIDIDIDIDFDFDFDFDWWSSRLVSSCNGLLCISFSSDETIILLNPCTRKYKVSPIQLIECPSQFISDNSVTFGFGFCHNSTTTTTITIDDDDDDEYKVVRISNFYPLNSHPMDISFQFQIDIYSMSSNSWRSWRGGVKDIPFKVIHDTQFGLFLNGSVHWLGSKHGIQQRCYAWDTIISFNIRDEEFRNVPIPPCADVVKDQDGGGYSYIANFISLMNVRGCLGNGCFLYRTQMMDIELEIWVMKEYGIRESWTKEFVITTSDSEPPRELSFDGLSSMTCSLTGDQIIIEAKVYCIHPRHGTQGRRRYGRRVLYDINKKKIDGDVVMQVNDFDLEQYQFDYIETLVSLKSSLHINNNNNNR